MSSVKEAKFHFLRKGKERYAFAPPQQTNIVWTAERWIVDSYWHTHHPVSHDLVQTYYSEFRSAYEEWQDEYLVSPEITDNFLRKIKNLADKGKAKANESEDCESNYLSDLSTCLNQEYFTECVEGREWLVEEEKRLKLLDGAGWMQWWCGHDWQSSQRWRDCDGSRNSEDYLTYKAICEELRRKVEEAYGLWEDFVWGENTKSGDESIAIVADVYQEILRELDECDSNGLKVLLRGLRNRYFDELRPVTESAPERLPVEKPETSTKKTLERVKANHTAWILQEIEFDNGLELTGATKIENPEELKKYRDVVWIKNVRGYKAKLLTDFKEWYLSNRRKKGKSYGKKPFDDAWELLGLKESEGT